MPPIGRMPTGKLKFDGKFFKFERQLDSRSEAFAEAQYFRTKGKQARVVKKDYRKSGMGYLYNIYVR